MKLEGKTALITGGTSGIGLATAQEFIRQGAKAVAFLASGDAYITGVELAVDGGRTQL